MDKTETKTKKNDKKLETNNGHIKYLYKLGCGRPVAGGIAEVTPVLASPLLGPLLMASF